jgi:hypothetical protein
MDMMAKVLVDFQRSEAAAEEHHIKKGADAEEHHLKAEECAKHMKLLEMFHERKIGSIRSCTN